jgi:hypothetical protein
MRLKLLEIRRLKEFSSEQLMIGRHQCPSLSPDDHGRRKASNLASKEMTMSDSNVELIRLSTSTQTVPPEAAQALEQVRQRRRAELGDWKPSNGWLAEASAVHAITRPTHRPRVARH